MNFGFRVGASYLMYGESLVFDANYNRFSAGKKHECWFDMNVIDLDVGYTFYRNYLIALRGFVGVEGAFLNKSYLEEIKETNHFKGAGPLVGLLFQWDMGAGFTFETLGALGSLYGSGKRDLNIVFSQVIHDKFLDGHFVALTDLRCGLRYMFPCLSWYGIGAFVGYEMRAILGQIGCSHTLNLTSKEGVSLLHFNDSGGGKVTLLQGVTFSVDVSF